MKEFLHFTFKISAFLLLLFMLSCSRGQKKEPRPFREEIDSIAVTWVPDIQEGIFEASVHSERGHFIISGETDQQGARDALKDLLNKKGVSYIDSMKVLPDTNSVKKEWGLVNVSVCNIRAYNSFDAELTTQALMGTPVRILKNTDGWLLIQTPDFYIGWVDSDAIQELTEGEYHSWKGSPRIFYMGKTGDIIASSGTGEVVSDIVAGCILREGRQINGYSEVILPDGRKGFIRKNDAIPFGQLNMEVLLTPANLANTARSFMGIPYLWGGTSSKGFDCSGFVKTVYYLNGIILSRDASQQFRHGTRLRRSWYPDSLKAGDLLFFGNIRHGTPHATHVAMYIGNKEFIHASGMVKINSLDSTRSNFSRLRRDSFLGVRRIIGAPLDKGIEPVTESGWYK